MILLRQAWTAEAPCPRCGGAVVWTMDDAEYSEMRRTLEAAGCGLHWAVEVICGYCDARLIVDLTLVESGGVALELHPAAVEAP